MESFFALLRKNALDRKRWRTREELRIAIITGIERTYHRRRQQTHMGRLTSIKYETLMNPTVSLAAQPPLTPERASVPVPLDLNDPEDLWGVYRGGLRDQSRISHWRPRGRSSGTRPEL